MAQPKIDGAQIDGGSVIGVDADQLGGQIGSFYNDSTNLTGIIPSARLTGTYTINVSGNAGTASNSSLLQGSNAAFFRNASNINAGTISDARLPNTISSDITGSAAKLGGAAASLYARLSNPIFTGNPRAPTAGASDNDTTIATTAFVKTAVGSSVTKITSPGFAYTGGVSTYVWNTGLITATPYNVAVNIICTIADGGYSPGHIISLNHTLSESDSGDGPQNDGVSVLTGTGFVQARVANRGLLALTTGNANFTPIPGRWNVYFKVMV